MPDLPEGLLNVAITKDEMTDGKFEECKRDYARLMEHCEKNPSNKDTQKMLSKMQFVLLRGAFRQKMKQRAVIDDLKNHNWKALDTWLGAYNTMNLTKEILAGFTDQDKELTMSDFEILLCMIFGELYRGLQAFLKGEDQWQSQGFQLAM